MENSDRPSSDSSLMKESTEAWEVLQVPSASGREAVEEGPAAVSQLIISMKPKKQNSMERLLMDAQRESSRQSSARQSLHQSKYSSPVFPDSPTESGDYYLGYDEFNRQMLSPSDADGSTDWFWDWNYSISKAASSTFHGHRARRIPRKLSTVKRKFLGLLLLTNVIALILGAGLGFYLGRKILAGQELNYREWDVISDVESGIFKYH